MARGLTLSAGGVTAFIAIGVLLHETCSATAKAHPCAPSSCGDIHNISSPFRLKTDPEICGDPRYELSCENNHTVVYLAEGRKYYVQEINYSMYTIRVVESGIQKENYIDISTPSNPLYRLLQYYYDTSPELTNLSLELFGTDSYQNRIMVFMSCEKPVNTPFYSITSTCIYNGEYSSNSSISDSKRHKYVTIISDPFSIEAKDVRDSCKVEKMVLTSWSGNDNPNISCTEVHNYLAYGFQLSWFQFFCDSNCGRGRSCFIYEVNRVHCAGKFGG